MTLGPCVMNLYERVNQTHRWPTTANKHIQGVFCCEPAGQPNAQKHFTRAHLSMCLFHLCALQLHNVTRRKPLLVRCLLVPLWLSLELHCSRDDSPCTGPPEQSRGVCSLCACLLHMWVYVHVWWCSTAQWQVWSVKLCVNELRLR